MLKRDAKIAKDGPPEGPPWPKAGPKTGQACPRRGPRWRETCPKRGKLAPRSLAHCCVCVRRHPKRAR